MSHLDEGVFFSDRHTKKISGKSKEEVQQKIDDFISQYKDYKPKQMGGIDTDRLGNFTANVSWQKKEHGEGIFDKIGRGIKKTKEFLDKPEVKKGIENVKSGAKAVATVVKDTASIAKDSVPKGTLVANSKFDMMDKKVQLQKKYPDKDIKYREYKDEEGFKADYYFRGSAKQTQQSQTQQPQGKEEKQPEQEKQPSKVSEPSDPNKPKGVTTLQANSREDIQNDLRSFMTKYKHLNPTVAKKIQQNPNGKWTITLNYDKHEANKYGPASIEDVNKVSGNNTVSNIQKQLSKLSGDKLKKIQDIINS